MRKILAITLSVAAGFIIEFLIFNFAAPFLRPNLLLLLVIFTNLFFGIRYSLYAAILGGVLIDSFASGPWGINMFSFVACAYLTTVFKKYIYLIGSEASVLLLAGAVVVANFFMEFFLNMIFADISLGEALRFIFFREAFMTLVVTPVLFREMRRCVLRLYA